jgi:hypothetical protein
MNCVNRPYRPVASQAVLEKPEYRDTILHAMLKNKPKDKTTVGVLPYVRRWGLHGWLLLLTCMPS